MNSKLITLLSLVATLFILIFFTRPLFYALQQNMDLQVTTQAEQDKKKEQLKKIQSIQDEIKSGSGQQIQDIKMHALDFSEDKMISYIYNYIQDTGGLALVRELNMERGDINEFGFNEGRVQVELRVNDEAALLNFIEEMTNPTISPDDDREVYKFFIDTFTYPTEIAGSFNVSVPMKVFYK